MKHVLLFARLPDEARESERYALASELCVGTERITFAVVNGFSSGGYLRALRIYRNGGARLVDAVLLNDPTQRDIVIEAAREGVPHYIMLNTRSDDGSRLGLRLHRLQPTNEFVVCNPRVTA